MPPALEVDHLDGVRANNTIENLRWAGRSQNARNVHPGTRCNIPKAGEWLYNGEAVESWQALARVLGVTYIALKAWLQIYKDRLDGRTYHGGKFTRREQV